MLNKLTKFATVSTLGLAIASCATTPEPSNKMLAIQNQYSAVQQQAYVAQYAPLALDDAKKSIEKAKKMESAGEDEKLIEHQLYIADKKLNTAIELANQKRAEENIENAELNRKDALLAAKSDKLDAAQTKAEIMAIRAEVAERQAAQATQQAQEMTTKAKNLAAKLEDISATQTERGLVITMGSILFELNKAELKPESQNTVARIAELLGQYPERNVLVEGFTDSSGTEQYNQNLSEQRAEQVVSLLTSNGIARNRLNATGYGEQYPTASNGTSIGRQKNRRVELVIANSDQSAVMPREN